MPANERRTPSEEKPARMDALARLPIFLALDGKRAVVAGGSPAAAWKAELLSASGALVEVYAADPSDELLQIAENPSRGAIAINRRGWTADDVKGAAIAIGAFDDNEAAAAFSSAARARGVPVNVIDKPAFCDFAFGAIVNRSPLVIGISTDGAAPVFAQAIRAKLEALLPNGFTAGHLRLHAGEMQSRHPVCLFQDAASSGSCLPPTQSPTLIMRRVRTISIVSLPRCKVSVQRLKPAL